MSQFRICEILNIQYPIILGPMLGVSRASLVSAFSNAGGLGCLATANMNVETFTRELEQIEATTDKPFAVNIAWVNEESAKIAGACLEHNVKVILSSAGCPADAITAMKKAGVKVLQLVADQRMAKRAEGLGVDIIIAKGGESGGLNANNSISSMVLLPEIAEVVSIPVVAAGGFANGKGLAAALALGADGVLFGTRFIATTDTEVHETYKQAIVTAGSLDTQAVYFGPFCARTLKGKKATELDGAPNPFDHAGAMDSPCDLDRYIYGSGQVAGLVHKIDSTENIIEDIITDCKAAITRLNGMRDAL